MCGAAPAQKRLAAVASFGGVGVERLIEACLRGGVRAVEVDHSTLPAGPGAVRSVRDKFAGSKVRVHAVAWKGGKEADPRAGLTAANVLDARYLVANVTGALAPKLHAESIRAGVPVALRNGSEGVRTPDEIVSVLRANSHLGLAFDPARMLADGHDPGVFLRRVARRLMTVYCKPGIDDSVRIPVLRAVYALRPSASITLELSDAAEFKPALELLDPPKRKQ